MISPDDLILLPYSSDLTPAAIAYICQNLPLPASQIIPETFRGLRHLVAQKAAELSFQRHITSQQVPHKLGFQSRFASPGLVRVVIGGRNCSLHNSAIWKRQDILRVHKEPATLLSYQAVLPSAELFQETHLETDLLVFSFVTGLVTQTRAETIKALSAGKTAYILYPLTAAWSQPSHRGPLGKVILKSESDRELTITLGGYDEKHSFVSEEVNLPPRRRVQARQNYYSLAYLQTSRLPTRRLGLHCPALDKTLLIQPHQWGNIWVYGMRVGLAGWITRQEFRQYARPCSNDQYYHTPKKGNSNYVGVPVIQLHSLKDLFARAMSWG
jgi:hypothetical protein